LINFFIRLPTASDLKLASTHLPQIQMGRSFFWQFLIVAFLDFRADAYENNPVGPVG
jgi:hypothetical protein